MDAHTISLLLDYTKFYNLFSTPYSLENPTMSVDLRDVHKHLVILIKEFSEEVFEAGYQYGKERTNVTFTDFWENCVKEKE